MSVIRHIMKRAWQSAEKTNAQREARQPSVPGARVESCIPYTTDSHPMHLLNLYYPTDYSVETDGRLPVIIDIHGGGLMYGDKELNRRYCEYLSAKGFCVMGMSYRLLPETDLRGMTQDVFTSLHWLERHGPKRGFDLSNVLLTGDSAGGHLASLVMCIQRSEKLQKIYGVIPMGHNFRAVAISNGVCEMHDYYDYTPKLNKLLDREIISMILGKVGAKASWRNHMNFSQVLSVVDTLPPLLVIGAECDPFYRQTQWIMENLDRRGHHYEKLIWNREDGQHLGHVFHIAHWEWKESRETNDKMLTFFRGCIQ